MCRSRGRTPGPWRPVLSPLALPSPLTRGPLIPRLWTCDSMSSRSDSPAGAAGGRACLSAASAPAPGVLAPDGHPVIRSHAVHCSPAAPGEAVAVEETPSLWSCAGSQGAPGKVGGGDAVARAGKLCCRLVLSDHCPGSSLLTPHPRALRSGKEKDVLGQETRPAASGPKAPPGPVPCC